MSTTTPSEQEAQNAKEAIEGHLRSAGVGHTRSATIPDGSKSCYDHDDQHYPSAISGNYAVFGGDNLVLLDIDVSTDTLPKWVKELPQTFVVETPHGGYHRYYIVEDSVKITNSVLEWGSVRYEGQYVVGPGSVIDHSECNDRKSDCPGNGVGRYEIRADRPIATLSEDQLEALRDVCHSDSGSDSTRTEYGNTRVDLPDETVADEGEKYLCTDFARRATELAVEDVMDLLRGGTGSYELRRDDETGIDQSAADYYALEMLYGAFQFEGKDEDDARRFTLAVFKRYCIKNRFDKAGNLRKWLRKGERYLLEQMDAVQQKFDIGKWTRWKRRKNEDGFDVNDNRPWIDPTVDGSPSDITEDTVIVSLHYLTSDASLEVLAQLYEIDLSAAPPVGKCVPPSNRSMGPESVQGDTSRYPTAKEIGAFAAKINPERKASYFEETVKKLSRETRVVAHAYCPNRDNGERHVYYPSSDDDPEDARWIKIKGQKQIMGKDV